MFIREGLRDSYKALKENRNYTRERYVESAAERDSYFNKRMCPGEGMVFVGC